MNKHQNFPFSFPSILCTTPPGCRVWTCDICAVAFPRGNSSAQIALPSLGLRRVAHQWVERGVQFEVWGLLISSVRGNESQIMDGKLATDTSPTCAPFNYFGLFQQRPFASSHLFQRRISPTMPGCQKCTSTRHITYAERKNRRSWPTFSSSFQTSLHAEAVRLALHKAAKFSASTPSFTITTSPDVTAGLSESHCLDQVTLRAFLAHRRTQMALHSSHTHRLCESMHAPRLSRSPRTGLNKAEHY